MAKREANNTDRFIRRLLEQSAITYDEQGSTKKSVNAALKSASKKQTGHSGAPEFTAVVNGFVLVIEDKPDSSHLVLREIDGTLSQASDATVNYAVNGALWYARKIVEQTEYKRVFAFGNVGDAKHHAIMPLFVEEKEHEISGKIIKNVVWQELKEVSTFENFTIENIEDYYKRAVLGEQTDAEKELKKILDSASELHEDLRSYGALGDTEKPIVVSAILLALNEPTFSIDQLKGDSTNTDGNIIYNAVEVRLTKAQVTSDTKKEQVMAQFAIIKNRPILNEGNSVLGECSEKVQTTPLHYFAEYINKHIYKAVMSDSPEDYLGRFYGEFISYSGGDGQTLGVVLTPRHITELFCELVNLRPDDVVLDPCCGTGGFLISAMQSMLGENANNTAAKKDRVKSAQIHGIELRDDMFAIATTNMILRGDGKSNIRCRNFLTETPLDLQTRDVLIGGKSDIVATTVGFMNPPYSQKKNPATAHLSELSFVRHLLESVVVGGRVAVIVPVSAMIGKDNEEKAIKAEILKSHTLEGVISLSKNTFYRVGTVPCIAVFTSGRAHPTDKQVKFINFEDDGFEIRKHIGLVRTERAKDRKKLLLDCWNENADAPSKFMVKTTIEDTDEWLHSFYYYNDEIPTEEDFLNSIADYLTFEFNMVTHGRGYLFEGGNINA
jgi:type I restriction-modification system DNA methylase subunit